jgi:urease beta subunit
MSKINDVNSAIMFGDFSDDQLNSIIMAVKYRRAQLIKENKRAIQIGSNVKFYSTRKNREFQGNVTKIATKFVTVQTPQGAWKVPASMLEIM